MGYSADQEAMGWVLPAGRVQGEDGVSTVGVVEWGCVVSMEGRRRRGGVWVVHFAGMYAAFNPMVCIRRKVVLHHLYLPALVGSRDTCSPRNVTRFLCVPHPMPVFD